MVLVSFKNIYGAHAHTYAKIVHGIGSSRNYRLVTRNSSYDADFLGHFK